MFFSGLKNDRVKLSELFPTLKKSKSPTFQALSNIKNDKVLFSELKKCGNLNFLIFYVGKSEENWTLLFLLAKKVRKVGLCHF
jgi:hypothetical protein